MKTLNFFASAFLLCLISFGNIDSHAGTCQPSSLEMMVSCPTASFTIVNNGVTAGTPVNFTNQSTGATSYRWDFGDGTFSADVNPSHVYASAGNYTVKLLAITDACTVEFIGTEEVTIL